VKWFKKNRDPLLVGLLLVLVATIIEGVRQPVVHAASGFGRMLLRPVTPPMVVWIILVVVLMVLAALKGGRPLR
jgi:hypothetical protein